MLQSFDRVVVHSRPAVFLWYYWAGRHYGRIRYTDTNERAVVNVMDIKPLAEACVEAIRDAFELEAAQEEILKRSAERIEQMRGQHDR